MAARTLLRCATSALALAWPSGLHAGAPAALNGVDYALLPGQRVLIGLRLTGTVPKPLSFATHDPPRIALDFPGVTVMLDRKTHRVGVGMVRDVVAVRAGNRTRVVIRLLKLVPHTVRTVDRTVYVTVGDLPRAPC